MPEPGLRESKKRETRRALIEAAFRLFDARGYEHTTVAEVAERAGVSPATFFNYFASKEDVVFADQPYYDQVLEDVYAEADGSVPVPEMIVHTLRTLATAPDWTFPADHPLSAIRARLIAATPALRAGFLLRNAEVGDRWAAQLHRVYPDVLGQVEAGAVVGAVVGAMQGAIQANTGPGGRPRMPAPGAVEQIVMRVIARVTTGLSGSGSSARTAPDPAPRG